MRSELELEDLRCSFQGMLDDVEDLSLAKLTVGDLRYLLTIRDKDVSDDSDLEWERENLRSILLEKGN